MLFDQILNAGSVAMVLLGLSVLALALFLERLWSQLSYPRLSARGLKRCERLLQNRAFYAEEFNFSAESHGWQAGVALLVSQRELANDQRQQLAEAWLLKEQRFLNARLKLLGLVGALAPLLGLLGTVFGIIEMFKAIAHSTGPVTPAVLADGMWEAMVTTALGLVIAIPALAASHGLDQLSQWRLHQVQDGLNEVEIKLQGVVEAERGEATEPHQGTAADQTLASISSVVLA